MKSLTGPIARANLPLGGCIQANQQEIKEAVLAAHTRMSRTHRRSPGGHIHGQQCEEHVSDEARQPHAKGEGHVPGSVQRHCEWILQEYKGADSEG